MRRIFLLLVVSVVALGAMLALEKLKTTSAPVVQTGEQSLSDGVIKFSYPKEFGLAVSAEQVLLKSYIPPCNENFDYCLYYYGNGFAGSNFESAGIRVDKLLLPDKKSCLFTPPEGYPKLGSSSLEKQNYSASIFSPIGDAAAGHYSNGEIYRIFTSGKCYELETRIGESESANYPEGTIRKFSEIDRDRVYSLFNLVLSSLTLTTTGEHVSLPASED